jgi:hypothetical protein
MSARRIEYAVRNLTGFVREARDLEDAHFIRRWWAGRPEDERELEIVFREVTEWAPIGDPSPTFDVGKQVRVSHPFYSDGKPDPRHGVIGIVSRTPGQEATPGSGVPSSTYAIQFPGSPHPVGGILPEWLVSA